MGRMANGAVYVRALKVALGNAMHEGRAWGLCVMVWTASVGAWTRW